MLISILLTLTAQLPDKLPHGVAALQIHKTWVLISDKGEVLGELQDIDGAYPLSLRPLPSGKGVVFTAARPGKNTGLFIKRFGEPLTDISISKGYHAWPAVSPDEKSVVIAHQAGPDSGPIGSHGPNANAQLWRVPLSPLLQDGPQQLTETSGCKSSPSFTTNRELVFGHNNCRGTQGIEWIPRGQNTIQVVLPNISELVLNPEVSPDGKLVAFVRKHYQSKQVFVADWPSLKNERLVASSADGAETPTSSWLALSSVLLIAIDVRIDKYSLKDKKIKTIWREPEVRR